MKATIRFLLALVLVSVAGYGQSGEKFNVIQLRERAAAPTSSTWGNGSVYFGTDQNLYIKQSGSFVNYADQITSSIFTGSKNTTSFLLNTTPQTFLEVGTSGPVGSTPYARMGGGQGSDGVIIYLTDNYAGLSGLSNAEIDAAGDTSMITKGWFQANAGNGSGDMLQSIYDTDADGKIDSLDDGFFVFSGGNVNFGDFGLFAIQSSSSNFLGVGESGPVGSTPYVRIMAGNSADAVTAYFTDNRASIAGYSNSEIDAVGDTSLLTKLYGDTFYRQFVTAGTNVTVTGDGSSGNPYVINATGTGSGDMLKSTYDADDDGLIDGIEDDIVTSAKILNNTIISADILDGTIGADDLAINSVNGPKIDDFAVSTGKIVNGAVDNSKLSTMPASTIKGNASASPASPQDLSISEVKTLLAFEESDIANLVGDEALRMNNVGSNGQVIGLASDVTGILTYLSESQLKTNYNITDDQTASEVPFTPNGSISSTDVQSAIQEVRDEAGSGIASLQSQTGETNFDIRVGDTAYLNGLSTPPVGTLALEFPTDSAQPEVIQIACSDLTTDVTTGTTKAYFRMPYAMTLIDVRVSLLTAGTATGLTVDINEGGTTVLSTKLTTDATEKTSESATTAAVISDSALADDAEITIDFDAVPTGGQGVIVSLIGTRS
ncbi:hypothetical protein [Flagellimonas sp.]|uniref:hypothetical protein n=1 Tax=Flagellimonas sp. TaxID=2058762 RepID=UPI003F4A0FB6